MSHGVFFVLVIFTSCAVTSQGDVMQIALKGSTADYVVSSWAAGSRSKRSSDIKSNLIGRSGEGYYMEVEIGTPPQKVRFF